MPDYSMNDFVSYIFPAAIISFAISVHKSAGSNSIEKIKTERVERGLVLLWVVLWVVWQMSLGDSTRL